MASNAGQQITVTLGDKTFKCSRRTAAHLTKTVEELAKRFPKAHLHVMQGCYNTTIKASAGTHDYDACLDIRIDGLDWWAAQRFLRELGWAAWFRHTGSWASPSQWHIHMVSLPLGSWAAMVGVYVPGQVVDYYNHTFGLKGQHNVDLDKSWFPGDGNGPNPPVGTPSTWATEIRKTIFDYDKWLIEQEDNMGYRDWDQADKDAFMEDFWGYKPKGATAAVGQLVKQAANAPGLIRTLASSLGKAIK